MKVLIRADASAAIGSGHIMRTLELAKRLRGAGYTVVYLCKALEGDLRELIAKRGFGVETLEADADEYAVISEAVKRLNPFLLVIDHYGIHAGTEARLRSTCRVPLLAYDDTFASHASDIVLNQNIYASAFDYEGKVSETAMILAGVEYATIRDEFPRAKRAVKPRSERLKILVTMGGSDPGNATARVLEALGRYDETVDVTVVVGSANRHKDMILHASQTLASCEVIFDPPDMAALMAEADLAVTAAGQTTIEALFMELPTVNIMIADNQRLISSYLDVHDLSVSLPANFEPVALIEALELLREEKRVSAGKLKAVADRIGTRSAVDALQCLVYRRFGIEPTRPEAVRELFELANDADVRSNSLSTAPIEWEAHVAWFERSMNDPLLRLYTLKDAGGAFMGQLRFDCREPEEAVISISIVPAARGCGVATQVIRSGAALLFATAPERTIKAVVKSANAASRRSFERAGFKKVHDNADTVIYHLTKADHDDD